MVAPPTMDCFSTRITFWPLSASSRATRMPAPPAPTTTVSQVTSSLASCCTSTVRLFHSSASRPASSRHKATASTIALLVLVAPDTVSTARLWFSTIQAGISEIGLSAMPSVSEFSTTSTRVTAPSAISTSTVTGPLLPWADCVYTSLVVSLWDAGAPPQAESSRANASITARKAAAFFVCFIDIPPVFYNAGLPAYLAVSGRPGTLFRVLQETRGRLVCLQIV